MSALARLPLLALLTLLSSSHGGGAGRLLRAYGPRNDALQGPHDPRAEVRQLAETGRLEEAERLARSGGAALTVPLGEVLLLRGQLAQAESCFTAAVRGKLAGQRSAEAALAELAVRQGDHAEARRRAEALALAYERSGNGASWSSEDRTAAGRALVVLGAADPESVREALRSFDAAVARDSGAIEPRLRSGDLFLDHYNAPDARASYQGVLALQRNQPRALLGLAKVFAFEGSPEAFTVVRRSLAANPRLVAAEVLLGELSLDAEQYDSAGAAAARALATDSASVPAWALLGATRWLREDSTGFAATRAAVGRVHPRPAEFYAAVAEAAARHRRYAEAVRFGREAVALDSSSSRALGVQGLNELRTGAMDSGRAHLERAFSRDPYHLWYKNTLDLLDELRGFRTISTRRFRIVAPAEEAELLGLYLGPLLEQAYDSLAARYDYQPPVPVRIELFRRHADFSVRTAGLTGLGALGVSFGSVLAMDAPSARERGSFNWGSTAWHELTHAFTLGLSNFRVPRWFSEGLSVLEERRARPGGGWGAGPSLLFLAALKGDKLLAVSRLNEGFVRPSHPAEIQFSYYEASLACEMIEQQWGRGALVAMLRGYRDGLATPAVFQKMLGLGMDAMAQRFAAWMRQRFAGPLKVIAPWDGKGPAQGELVSLLRDGKEQFEAGRRDEARASFERAAALFPEYTGAQAPPLMLARLARERGDPKAALAALARYTTLDESAWDANADEAALREQTGDVAGAAAALERMLWISPYDAGVHLRLAGLAERLGDFRRAVRERRATLAAQPADPLEARYQLARTLSLAGDSAAARREILQVLEGAPGFEKAQLLLLQLKGRVP
ncbi:MAG TPA: tetratricopeptide repeat protein [Gemmatimonadales bacterium]|nr:tetratricopeptide repeat protein [Gemmatimonadales bacterium]